MRRIGRSAAKCAVGLIAVALVLALVAAVLLRTAPGRRLLLRAALPLLNRHMAGHLSIDAIDGDVPAHFVLRNARLDDAEGFEAIFARRAEVRLDWRQLLHRHIAIEDLRVEGARLTLRHLRDNRLNLAALPKPADKQAPA